MCSLTIFLFLIVKWKRNEKLGRNGKQIAMTLALKNSEPIQIAHSGDKDRSVVEEPFGEEIRCVSSMQSAISAQNMPAWTERDCTVQNEGRLSDFWHSIGRNLVSELTSCEHEFIQEKERMTQGSQRPGSCWGQLGCTANMGPKDHLLSNSNLALSTAEIGNRKSVPSLD